MFRKLFLSIMLTFCLISGIAVVVDANSSAWIQTCGGTGSNDSAWSLVATADGGYAIAGYTNSSGAGGYDFWLIKVDASGNVQWNKTYGGTLTEQAFSIVVTSDGGYALTGRTYSFGERDSDFWLVKTDEFGNEEWNQTYGGSAPDYGRSLVQTSDGGYAIAGITDPTGEAGFLLVKTDEFGNEKWNQTYKGTVFGRLDYLTTDCCTLISTSDEGYALAGFSDSFSMDEKDFWLIKVDSAGEMEWNQTYGGEGSDLAYSVVETSDEGYVLAGYTASFGVGGADFWLLKTDAAGNMEWNQTYGESGDEIAYSMVATSDGGYILAGLTQFAGNEADFLVVKTDASGNMEWNQTFGESEWDVARSVVQSFDGGYAVTGYTGQNYYSYDFLLVKTDEYGIDPYLRPPEVCIVTPQNNTCTTGNVPLNFTVDEETSWIRYSLDGQDNITITGNTTLTGLADGSHSLILYANDTDGNVGVSEEVFFTVDNNAPAVSVLEPKNITYSVNEVLLNFTVDETCSEIIYCLDGQENVTINANTTLTELPNGSHTIVVYATDTVGNTGTSETINFTVATEANSTPWIIIVTAIAVGAIAGTAALIYYKKGRKQQKT